ncbi:MAG: polyphosphate kinase 1 [Hallerella sp.]|nr:polyphosphate kinase 1 [Hallerella sp.]MCI5601096.1 polyphosphate kinase 1 [Hallerella sp.]
MTASEQLDAIFSETSKLYKKKDSTYSQIKSELSEQGIEFVAYKKCNKEEKKFLKEYYQDNILPLLSPQIVDARHPTPNLQSKISYIVASLKNKNKNILGLVQCPATIPEIIPIGDDSKRFIFAEELIVEHIDEIFSMYKISDKNIICITRNGDLTTDEETDGSEDYRNQMKLILKKRRVSFIVRVEAAKSLSSELEEFILRTLKVQKKQIFVTSAPLKMKFPFSLPEILPVELSGKLSYPLFSPVDSKSVDAKTSMISQISERDLMLSYPYEKMDPFLKLIKEAAEDPNTLSIKITIYRLAHRAKLVDYLCRAAENGIEVTTLIELRARFDELNNIDWSERLEDAGCHVLYGPEGYKVHSKICLITRRNDSQIQYITQIGTGNYNEKTCKLYTDISFMTSDVQIGKDAVEFFKNVCIGNLGGKYSKLLVSPLGLKSKILQLIDSEIAKKSEGALTFKMNSLTDVDVIEKLVEASQAGVKINLIIRGICCLLPGIPGITDNITIRSIVGKFLEHSRIYAFGKGAKEQIFIGSADMMTRNTENRVEVITPIKSKEIKNRLRSILNIMLLDNVKARLLQPSGKYIKIPIESSSDEKLVNAQEMQCEE